MKRLAFAFCVLAASGLWLSSCATDPIRKESPPPPPTMTDPRLDQEVRAATAALRGPDSKRAVLRLKRVAREFSRTTAADDARMALGYYAFEAQNYPEAYSEFAASANGPRSNEATLRAARCLLLMRRADDAIRVLDQRRSSTDTPDQAQEERRIRYEAAIQTRRHLDALRALAQLAENAPNPQERERYRQSAADAVENRVTEDDVKRIADSSQFGSLQANAKLRYGSMLLDQRQASRARSELQEAAEIGKGTDVATRAQRLLEQIDARQRLDSRTIGVVLPLTGKQSIAGYKSLRGIQLGLGIYGKVPSGLKLAVVDSEGNPDVARRAVERLVAEDGAIAIIGGLLSRTASAEAAKAQELGVPAIMLSQKSGVTQVGDAIFRNALTSQMQVQRLVEIAMNDLHLTRFAMLFPNDAYGAEYANLFWDEVKARGGAIVGAQPYDPKARDFRPYVQRLAGVFYVEDRWEEYRFALRRWQQRNPRRSVRNSGPTFEDLIGPAADFEALFVPDRTDAVRLIAPALPLYDLEKVRLLGTNLWNRAELVEHKNRDIERAIFVDSPSPTDSTAASSEFASAFRAAFGEEPGVFELQAYDSSLILRHIVAGGESSRSGVIRRLAELKNFPGALGSLSTSPNREIKRPMVGLTVLDGKIGPIEESPQR